MEKAFKHSVWLFSAKIINHFEQSILENMPTTRKRGRSRVVEAWQHLHNTGFHAPVYTPEHVDWRLAKRKLVEAAEQSLAAKGNNEPHRILDVGAGKGTITSVIGVPGVEVVSLEPTEIEMNSHAMPHSQVRALGEKMPLRGNSCDSALVTYTLCYTDRRRVAAELKRVVKPEGQIVMLLHKPSSRYLMQINKWHKFNGIVERILRNLKQGKYKSRTDIYSDATNYGLIEAAPYPTSFNSTTEMLTNLWSRRKAGEEGIEEILDDDIRTRRNMVASGESALRNSFKSEEHAKRFFEKAGFSGVAVETVVGSSGREEMGYLALMKVP